MVYFYQRLVLASFWTILLFGAFVHCHRKSNRVRKQVFSLGNGAPVNSGIIPWSFTNLNANNNPNDNNKNDNNGGAVTPDTRPVQWPGAENNFPFIAQWGPWTEQDKQRGSGQRNDQVRGNQLLPGQAQWYPNSPEYWGNRPAGNNQQQQPIINNNNNNNGFPNNQPTWGQGSQNWPQQQQPPPQQQQPFPNNQNPQGPFFGPQGQGQGQQSWPQQPQQPLGNQNFQPQPQQPQWQQGQQNYNPQGAWGQPSSTFGPGGNSSGLLPAVWSTWSEIKKESGSQWQDWHMAPDVWAQWQEWMVLQQRRNGQFPNGPQGQAVNQNQTFPDDTSRILVDILAGFVAGTYPRTVAMYNAKTFYPQYRKDYWIGLRFYALDPQSTLTSFITCTFPIPPDINVQYEMDKARVDDLVFQCAKFQETCCKLNCCDLNGNPLYYNSWVGPNSSGRIFCLKLLSIGLSLLSVLFLTFY